MNASDSNLLTALLHYVLKYREEYTKKNLLSEHETFDKFIIPMAKLLGLTLEFGDVVEPTITTRPLTAEEEAESTAWAMAFIERHIK